MINILLLVEASPSRRNVKNNNEKLVLNDKKYYHMLPEQINIIVTEMLESITKNNKLNFVQFRKWLDMNPSVRKIISDCVRPNLWTIDGFNNVYIIPELHNSPQTKI